VRDKVSESEREERISEKRVRVRDGCSQTERDRERDKE